MAFMDPRLKYFYRTFYKVPFLVPYWGRGEIIDILGCMLSGRIISGPDINAFEQKMAEFLGIRHAIALNMGRSAIELALHACKVGKDDEVIIPDFTCSGVLEPVVRLEARAIYADCGRDLNMNIQTVKNVVTDRTRAIIICHTSGKSVDGLEELVGFCRENGIAVIEDAAQALGASYNGKPLGTFGDFGIFSFGLGKNIMSSSGGLLVTDDNALYKAAICVGLRHESAFEKTAMVWTALAEYRFRKYTLPFFLGMRYLKRLLKLNAVASYRVRKMSNIDAKICKTQLSKLERIVAQRKANAAYLIGELKQLSQISLDQQDKDNIYTKFVVSLDNKHDTGCRTSRSALIERFNEHMIKNGIETEWSYVPLHLQDGSTNGNGMRQDSYYTTDTWCSLIALPVNPWLNKKDMEYVSKAVKSFVSGLDDAEK